MQSLRDLVPSDLQRRLVEAIREVLLAVRALIDWYLERIEQRHAEPRPSAGYSGLVVHLAPPDAYNRDVARTWILTGSPENYAATQALGCTVIGLKERNRNRALAIEPGDRVVLYLTRLMVFAASLRVEGEMYEDRTKIWPGKPGKVDAYPWRFPTSPELVLEDDEWVPAESMVDQLEHIQKWPREHWTLAFQGQIRALSDHDAEALMNRLDATAGAPAAG